MHAVIATKFQSWSITKIHSHNIKAITVCRRPKYTPNAKQTPTFNSQPKRISTLTKQSPNHKTNDIHEAPTAKLTNNTVHAKDSQTTDIHHEEARVWYVRMCLCRKKPNSPFVCVVEQTQSLTQLPYKETHRGIQATLHREWQTVHKCSVNTMYTVFIKKYIHIYEIIWAPAFYCDATAPKKEVKTR